MQTIQRLALNLDCGYFSGGTAANVILTKAERSFAFQKPRCPSKKPWREHVMMCRG